MSFRCLFQSRHIPYPPVSSGYFVWPMPHLVVLYLTSFPSQVPKKQLFTTSE